jgi:hypothetical protein
VSRHREAEVKITSTTINFSPPVEEHWATHLVLEIPDTQLRAGMSSYRGREVGVELGVDN